MTARIAVITFVCLSWTGASHAQAVENESGLKLRENTFSIYGGMGISIADAPGLVHYLNMLDYPTVLSDFATDVEFFGGVEFPLSFEWGGALEYSYLFKSYTLPTGDAGTYSVFYSMHMPTVMAHYVVTGEGYFLKFGGGFGYHTGSLEQKDPYGNDITYSAHGIGLKAQAVGETAFDEHLYGYIGGDMRWEIMGKLKSDNGTVLQNQGQVASLSMFVVGLNFGVIYYF